MIKKVLSVFFFIAVMVPPSYAQPAEDVEACVESKREQYPGDTLNNMRQRCFPIAATCWGWGAGENAVYEYCGADALRDRGVDSLAKDQDSKSDWE